MYAAGTVFAQVMEQLSVFCYDKLETGPPIPQPFNPYTLFSAPGAATQLRSVLDDFSSALAAITTLVRSDKAMGRELAVQKCFRYSEEMNTSKVPNVNSIPPPEGVKQ